MTTKAIGFSRINRTTLATTAQVGLIAVLLLIAGALLFGCASDVKQRQSVYAVDPKTGLPVEVIRAEGGLNNITDATADRIRTGVNYPTTSLSSSPDGPFSSTGPGSQTTLFNRSFGTAMVAGVLKASKLKAVTQENDTIDVENLEIDNSANAAPAWAKAIETQIVEANREQRAIAVEQIRAMAATAEGITKAILESVIAAINPAAGASSAARVIPSGPIVVPAPDATRPTQP